MGTDSAGGSDLWKPRELKALPLAAWVPRAEILRLALRLQRPPTPYLTVLTPAIPKKTGTGALDHRLLAIFSAVYRVEAMALFAKTRGWLVQHTHKSCHGGVPGEEALDAAWDCQAEIENAMFRQKGHTVITMDYYKFFDYFDHDFTKEMLIHVGIHPDLANYLHNLNRSMTRVIKIGKAWGPNFSVTNGLGQGDPLSLIPALILVTWQFNMLDKKHPKVTKGAVVDDRNLRGECDDVAEAYRDAADFDAKAGHILQHEKTMVTTTTKNEAKNAKTLDFEGHRPKAANQQIVVGNLISTSMKQR